VNITVLVYRYVSIIVCNSYYCTLVLYILHARSILYPLLRNKLVATVRSCYGHLGDGSCVPLCQPSSNDMYVIDPVHELSNFDHEAPVELT
jgi:hypothetical protein